jgi:hypothetical protein
MVQQTIRRKSGRLVLFAETVDLHSVYMEVYFPQKNLYHVDDACFLVEKTEPAARGYQSSALEVGFQLRFGIATS